MSVNKLKKPEMGTAQADEVLAEINGRKIVKWHPNFILLLSHLSLSVPSHCIFKKFILLADHLLG